MARHYPTLSRQGFLLPSNIKASYEGAGEGRRSAGWDAPESSLNSINTPALRNLRSRSRAAVRNDPYAFNVVDKRVSNLIGTGITPRAQTVDNDLRKLLHVLWEDWVDESDADELTDFMASRRWSPGPLKPRVNASCGCGRVEPRMGWRCPCRCNCWRRSLCPMTNLKPPATATSFGPGSSSTA